MDYGDRFDYPDHAPTTPAEMWFFAAIAVYFVYLTVRTYWPHWRRWWIEPPPRLWFARKIGGPLLIVASFYAICRGIEEKGDKLWLLVPFAALLVAVCFIPEVIEKLRRFAFFRWLGVNAEAKPGHDA